MRLCLCHILFTLHSRTQALKKEESCLKKKSQINKYMNCKNCQKLVLTLFHWYWQKPHSKLTSCFSMIVFSHPHSRTTLISENYSGKSNWSIEHYPNVSLPSLDIDVYHSLFYSFFYNIWTYWTIRALLSLLNNECSSSAQRQM